MNEQEQALLRTIHGKRAVCAHIGIGADDRATQAARDRLADALANYRPAPAKATAAETGEPS